MSGEFRMDTDQLRVAPVATLDFAYGAIGEERKLSTPEDFRAHGENLARYRELLTNTTTADCGDERPLVHFADGTNDPVQLRQRITAQLFGGIGLATTKAAIAANAVVIRDASNVWEAYVIISELLHSLGQEDAGHAECGASNSVQKSVETEIQNDLFLAAIGLFVPRTESTDTLFGKNEVTKQRRLQAGFYEAWDAARHEAYLAERFPQNFATLAVDSNDQKTHGHLGSSVYAITEPGYGFAKNAMAKDTNQFAFSVTVPKMRELSNLIGGSQEERKRIMIGFADDTLRVGGGIVIKGMPVFA